MPTNVNVILRQPHRYYHDLLKSSKMKKTLSLLLISCSLSAFACGGYGDLYPKWSIGVIGYSNTNMPVAGMQNMVLPGVQFTHQGWNTLWAQRAAIEYSRYTMLTPDFPPGSADMMYTEGKENRVLVRVGLERGWFVHRLFRPYAAMDLGMQYDKSDIQEVGGIMGVNQRHEITTKGIGLMPTVGFKTFVGRKVCIYAEYRAEAFLNDVDTKTTYYNGNVDSRPTSQTKFDFSGGKIVQAGIQVMF
jgi:hypothetical protein